MDVQELYERLVDGASLEGDDGAIIITADLSPIGGYGAKVNPPTYKEDKAISKHLYIEEPRYDSTGVETTTVLLDAVQSQANRCEEALQRAIDADRLDLPHLAWEFEVDERFVRMTSLLAPHRSRDAYFRDSDLAADGIHFEKSPIGRSLFRATSDAARPYWVHTPADLVYGIWDSQRGGVGIKVPRAYSSEVVGWDVVVGMAGAGRYDPLINIKDQKVVLDKTDRSGWALSDKGDELSKTNLAMIPPIREARGVSVTRITRQAVISFPVLARLSFPDGPSGTADSVQDRAGRAVLAALALLGDRLAFDRPAIHLRSGCTLEIGPDTLAWAGRGGRRDEFELDRAMASELLSIAVDHAAEVGLTWRSGALAMTPRANLRAAIQKSLQTPEEG